MPDDGSLSPGLSAAPGPWLQHRSYLPHWPGCTGRPRSRARPPGPPAGFQWTLERASLPCLQLLVPAPSVLPASRSALILDHRLSAYCAIQLAGPLLRDTFLLLPLLLAGIALRVRLWLHHPLLPPSPELRVSPPADVRPATHLDRVFAVVAFLHRGGLHPHRAPSHSVAGRRRHGRTAHLAPWDAFASTLGGLQENWGPSADRLACAAGRRGAAAGAPHVFCHRENGAVRAQSG